MLTCNYNYNPYAYVTYANHFSYAVGSEKIWKNQNKCLKNGLVVCLGQLLRILVTNFSYAVGTEKIWKNQNKCWKNRLVVCLGRLLGILLGLPTQTMQGESMACPEQRDQRVVEILLEPTFELVLQTTLYRPVSSLSERHSLPAAMLVQISEPNHGFFCIEPIYDYCQRRLQHSIFTPNPSPPLKIVMDNNQVGHHSTPKTRSYMEVLQG